MYSATKSEKASTKRLVVYNPHTSVEEQVWNSSFLRIASIDPGRKNFALRIEKRQRGPNPKIQAEVFIRKTFSQSYNGDYDTLYCEILAFLDSYLDLLKKCHYVLIERQLPNNYQSVRVSQHVLTYVLVKLKDAQYLPIIAEVHPSLKGKMLSAPSNINSNGLKKWAVEKAIEICEQRDETSSAETIRKERGARGQTKGDDLADTILQIEAVMMMVPDEE
jgi:hypothetical protein